MFRIVYCLVKAVSELFQSRATFRLRLNLPSRATHTFFCHASAIIDHAIISKVMHYTEIYMATKLLYENNFMKEKCLCVNASCKELIICKQKFMFCKDHSINFNVWLSRGNA